MKEEIKKILISALQEDLGAGDVTSNAIFADNFPIGAEITVKDERLAERSGMLAGMEEARFLIDYIGGIEIKEAKGDGEEIGLNDKVCRFVGRVKEILAVERTILNLLGRMSGIATITHWLQADNKVKVAATRKSPPCLLSLDKKAVEIGGGLRHRLGLWDKVLIKDSHLNALMQRGLSKEEAIVKTIKSCKGREPVEVEVESLEEALIAAKNGADVVMLDNFSAEDAVSAVKELRALGVKVEISGGVNAGNIEGYAISKPDWISLGMITHSVKAIDMNLKVTRPLDHEEGYRHT